MKLEYAPAKTADIPVIFSQAKALIDAYEDVSAIDYDKVLAWARHKIEIYLSEYTCVMADGKACAYYRLCEDGEVDDLYVLSGFRSRGIGSAIMQKCVAESGNHLYLYVFSRNTRAISFYERFGFVVQKTVGDTRLIMGRNG